jgi:transcriptional regulator with XRE-family HTH domain
VRFPPDGTWNLKSHEENTAGMPSEMEINVKDEVAALNLGKKIRNLRKRRGLTLQAVSDMTGLSKPLLSQVENNLAAPPIATLIKISTALGVKISHFFQDHVLEDRIALVRRDERYGVKKLAHHERSSEIGYRYESLAYPLLEKQMEPFVAEFEVREENELLYNNHKGEEFIFLLEGRLEFRSPTRTCVLEVGDSLYFDSGISHAFRGLGGVAKAVVVVLTPK